MHMLRVAACSNLIIDNWTGTKIDRESIIRANEEKANHLIECSLGIEKQVMEQCNLNPEDINDNSIKTYIERLKEYDI